MAKKEEKKAWRFWRSNLSSIVWDPSSDKPLADFTKGHFTTEDPKVAKKLMNLGYMQIPLDATEPPANIIIQQPVTVMDGDVPIIGPVAVPELVEAQMKAKMKTVGGPPQLNEEMEEKVKLPKRRNK